MAGFGDDDHPTPEEANEAAWHAKRDKRLRDLGIEAEADS